MIGPRFKEYMRCLTIIVLFFIFVVVGPRAGTGDDYVPDQLVCKVDGGFTIDYVNSNYGTSFAGYRHETGGYLLTTQPGANVDSLAAVIADDVGVVYCEPNYYVDAPEGVQSSQPFLDVAAEGSVDNQTAVITLGVHNTTNVSSSSDLLIGVIDGGIDSSHPMLSGSVAYGFDYVDQDSVSFDEPGGIGSGHGTFVAGVTKILAPEADLRAYRVLDTTGRGDGWSVAQAVMDAVNDSCRVINLSIVMRHQHASLAEAIAFAHENDVLVVAAAGNDSTNADLFPASDPYTLSVAALDSLNRKADFSNYGATIDISAPGTQIYAAFLDEMYAWWDGTSFATPFVTGQAAMLRASNPNATADEITQAIVASATNIDSENPLYAGMLGAGLINPLGALKYLAEQSCGDANQDGLGPDINDLTTVVDHLFGDTPVRNVLIADVDNVGGVDVGDLTYLIDYLFMDGPAPVCGQ